jgi:hypothetical protein
MTMEAEQHCDVEMLSQLKQGIMEYKVRHRRSGRPTLKMNGDRPNDDEVVMINLDARPKKGILKARPTAVAAPTEEMASHSHRREWSLCSRPVLWQPTAELLKL